MTNVTPCLWSLLDNASLHVIYASPAIANDMRSFMMQRSLLDLMHPDEVELARLDLARFVQSKSLHGSVTRCRLRNLLGYKPSSDASCAGSDAHWLVVDVVLYAATDRQLLAFFHVDPGSLSIRHSVACGETYFNDADSNELVRSIMDSPSSPTNNNSTQRFLHIFDSRTKTSLLSWPERYHHETTLASLLNHTSNASCFSSSHQRTPIGTLAFADHIIIPYGCITFVLTHDATAAQANSFVPQQRLAPLSHNANEPCKLPGLHTTLPHLAEESFFGSAPIKRHHASLLFDGVSKPFIPYARRNVHQDVIDPPQQPQRKRRHSSSPKTHHPSVAQNRCESCGTDSSPEWRKGPSGHKTLCNACGLRYSRSVARKEKMAHQQQQQQQQQHHHHHHQQYRGATRYSAPSSPVSSCSSSSSSSASSSPTSASGPVPHYNMKPFYDPHQRYDPIFRF
ncbi:hypothetical protein BJV82DRAFT_261764 [Fennellomyces sp. T-0311]|nr:hypothetical protein BJV82DRAFT_261764 [Fennellomyces sp. T-0311]